MVKFLLVISRHFNPIDANVGGVSTKKLFLFILAFGVLISSACSKPEENVEDIITQFSTPIKEGIIVSVTDKDTYQEINDITIPGKSLCIIKNSDGNGWYLLKDKQDMVINYFINEDIDINESDLLMGMICNGEQLSALDYNLASVINMGAYKDGEYYIFFENMSYDPITLKSFTIRIDESKGVPCSTT